MYGTQLRCGMMKDLIYPSHFEFMLCCCSCSRFSCFCFPASHEKQPKTPCFWRSSGKNCVFSFSDSPSCITSETKGARCERALPKFKLLGSICANSEILFSLNIYCAMLAYKPSLLLRSGNLPKPKKKLKNINSDITR